jgi:hypothetical protein
VLNKFNKIQYIGPWLSEEISEFYTVTSTKQANCPKIYCRCGQQYVSLWKLEYEVVGIQVVVFWVLQGEDKSSMVLRNVGLLPHYYTAS